MEALSVLVEEGVVRLWFEVLAVQLKKILFSVSVW